MKVTFTSLTDITGPRLIMFSLLQINSLQMDTVRVDTTKIIQLGLEFTNHYSDYSP